MNELCARCKCIATDEIFCKRHYEQWLREWSCYSCGEVNGGAVNRFYVKCGFCKAPFETMQEHDRRNVESQLGVIG